MYIVLIVKIWNVLDVNRLGDYICVCLTRVAQTELETVGNDSCSIPEEEEEGFLMSQSESRDLESEAPRSWRSMVILQNCFVIRLNPSCISELDKKILFTGWYISNVQETIVLPLRQRVDACFKTCLCVRCVTQYAKFV